MAMLLDDMEIAEHVASTPDGRLWGPFESGGAARKWERLFSSGCTRLATAAEVWEGRVPEGQMAWLVSDFAVEHGLHPFREVHDWFIQHDNGSPVAEMLSGPKRLHPMEAVFVETAERAARPARRLPRPETCPAAFDLDCQPDLSIPSRFRGEIVVARRNGGGWLVGWRPDRRATRSLKGLSLHDVEACAARAAEAFAEEWKPPVPTLSSKPRDSQRSLVYRWEARLGLEATTFGGIEECREFMEEACRELGIEPPELSRGRKNLANHSYYNGLRGIVLQEDMMDSVVILHELSHHAVRVGLPSLARVRDRQPAHGPRFVGVYAGVLALFGVCGLDRSIAMAREMGVEVDEDAAAAVAGRHAAGPNP